MSKIDIDIKWKGSNGVYLFGLRGDATRESELHSRFTVVNGRMIDFAINIPKFVDYTHVAMTAFILRGQRVDGPEGDTKYMVMLESTILVV